jgi:hypothetical protein
VTSPLLIYGANGYTGRLIAQAAVQRGLSPILAGRSTGPLRDLGESMGLPHRVASLKDSHGLDDLLVWYEEPEQIYGARRNIAPSTVPDPDPGIPGRTWGCPPP